MLNVVLDAKILPQRLNGNTIGFCSEELKVRVASQPVLTWSRRKQGEKKVNFTACRSGKLQLACTSPKVISTSPKNFDEQD